MSFMPPSSKSPTDQQQRIQHMLSALETPHKNLTPWEISFLESITDQFSRKGSLSDRQVEILDRIYSEKTP